MIQIVWIISVAVIILSLAGCGSHQPSSQLTPREGSVQISGMNQHYRIYGKGPPLLLLHGLTCTWRMWRPHIEALALTHELIIPDLRGHGYTSNPSSTLKPIQVAKDMFVLLDSLSVTNVQLAGYSFGGHVALRMAAEQPERIEAMVVIAGAHRLLGASKQLHESAGQKGIQRDWWFDEVVTWHPQGENQLRKLWSQGFDGVLTNDFAMSDSALSVIRARALIIQGDKDEMFPINVPLDLYKRMSKAQLWIIPNTTHSAVFWMDVAPIGTDFGGGRSAAGIFPDVVNTFLAAPMP